MAESTQSPQLELDESNERNLREGFKDAISLIQEPDGYLKSLQHECKISDLLSIYIETLQWEPETSNDIELLIFIDNELLPEEPPSDITQTNHGIPSMVSDLKEIAAEEVGYEENDIKFELTDPLVTQAIYRAYITVEMDE